MIRTSACIRTLPSGGPVSHIRHLAVTLGLIACAPLATAEDTKPAIDFGGWVDSVFGAYGSNAVPDNIATAINDKGWSARFSGAACLKASVKLNDQVSGKINLWFNPDYDLVRMRDAYIDYRLGDTFSVQLGKSINHIGWISPEPTGIYTVNPSLLGYMSSYGNDVLGVSLNVNPKDETCPFDASFHITNGYFSGWDGNNLVTGADGVPGYGDTVPWWAGTGERENRDLGYGFDLTYYFPDDIGFIDFDVAYDVHSRLNGRSTILASGVATRPLGGSVLLVGLNSKIYATKTLLFGAEAMSTKVGESSTNNVAGYVGNDRISTYQGLLMMNYKVETMAFPWSLTLMWQRINILTENPSGSDAYTNKTVKDSGQVVLLTNPTGNTNFGLNLEFGLWTSRIEDNSAAGAFSQPDRIRGWEASLEALLTF
jgi:hypothetical protein